MTDGEKPSSSAVTGSQEESPADRRHHRARDASVVIVVLVIAVGLGQAFNLSVAVQLAIAVGADALVMGVIAVAKR